MLPVFSRLSWVALFVAAFLVLGGGRAEAETALASWYGPGFEGLPTATGEPYNPYGYTAAHKTLPLGTELLVSYGGSTVEVTVNDRGPYVGYRELDLSLAAAEALGLTEPGVGHVEYAYSGGAAYQYAGAAAYDQYGYSEYGYDRATAGHSEYGYDGVVAAETTGYHGYVEEGDHFEDAGDGPTVSSHVGEGGGDAGIHVVRPGETLSGIAAGLGTSAEHLAAYNGISDQDLIYGGQVLYH